MSQICRVFNRRFYRAMIKNQPYQHIRIKPLHEGRHGYVATLRFLKKIKRVDYFPNRQWAPTDTLKLFTDTNVAQESAGLGCDVTFRVSGFFSQWPDSWTNTHVLRDITFLVLVPIVLALWKVRHCRREKIIFCR